MDAVRPYVTKVLYLVNGDYLEVYWGFFMKKIAELGNLSKPKYYSFVLKDVTNKLILTENAKRSPVL